MCVIFKVQYNFALEVWFSIDNHSPAEGPGILPLTHLRKQPIIALYFES